MEFGEKLKSLREEKGMTQQTLADHLYVTRQAVSKWECGSRYPDLMTTKKIADYLNVSIDELVSGDDWKDFAEKQPVIESGKTARIQTALYSIAAFLYLNQLAIKLPFYVKVLMNSTFTSVGFTRDDLFSLLPNLVLAIISCYAVIQSVKRNVGPKMIACITGVYLGSNVLFFTCVSLYTKSYEGLLSAIPELICLVVILLFFEQKTRRNPWSVYIVCGIHIFISCGYSIFLMFDMWNSPTKAVSQLQVMGIYLGSILPTISLAIIMVLTIVQAKIVSQKRKLEAKKV